MILWWHAVLISLASAGVTGLMALLVQVFQQKHDAKRQNIRVSAEAGAREEQAIRKRREERMEPIIQFLDDIDTWFAYRLGQSAGLSYEDRERHQQPPDLDVQAVLRIDALTLRIDDSELADNIRTLVLELFQGTENGKEFIHRAAKRLSGMHRSLEVYTARVVDAKAGTPDHPEPDDEEDEAKGRRPVE